MGYTTNFQGQITVDPPFNEHEIAYLTKLSETRRMARGKGPYYVTSSGFMGQDHEPDILNYDHPHPSQPSLWCHWSPNEMGDISWDQGEKFYGAQEWMVYIIQLFNGTDLPMQEEWVLPDEFAHFTPHGFNGTIEAQGEEVGDHWLLMVKDSVVTRVDLDGETFLRHLESMGHNHPDQAILDVPMDPEDNDAQASSVREYLKAWLQDVWDSEPKRIFGTSGWHLDIAKPLIQAGLITGAIDDEGYVDEYDSQELDQIIHRAIQAL